MSDSTLDDLRPAPGVSTPGTPGTNEPDTQLVPRSPVTGGVIIDGRYELGRVLDAGGMGTVYEARHLSIGRRVALKLSSNASQRIQERMVREAQIAAQIIDDGVVRILDVGQHESGSYIVMELLEGRDLEELVDVRGPLPIAGACSILGDVAAVCARMHAQGIIHRDLKPANVFLCDGGAVKVIDFGLAKEIDHPSSLTGTGVAMGTPAFMAPEQVTGSRNAGPAADCYALGGVLLFALTGAVPHGAENQNEQFSQALLGEVPALEELRPDAPGWLVGLVAALLGTDEEARPRAVPVAEALRHAS